MEVIPTGRGPILRGTGLLRVEDGDSDFENVRKRNVSTVERSTLKNVRINLC